MCGNASRCVGKYVYERGLTEKTTVALETLGGIKILQLHVKDGIVESVTVDMGEPVLEAAEIPVLSDKHPVIGETVEILDRKFDFTCVSMGNPHAVTFVENVMEYPIEKYGRVSEFHPIFPDRGQPCLYDGACGVFLRWGMAAGGIRWRRSYTS